MTWARERAELQGSETKVCVGFLCTLGLLRGDGRGPLREQQWEGGTKQIPEARIWGPRNLGPVMLEREAMPWEEGPPLGVSTGSGEKATLK